METRFLFQRPTQEALITLEVRIEFKQLKHKTFFAFDTGASQTVIDLNLLYQLDYINSKDYPKSMVRTGNGIVEGLLIPLTTFETLGKKVENFEVFAYDFLLTGSAEVYDGMIGLDFLNQTNLNVNLIENYIQIVL